MNVQVGDRVIVKEVHPSGQMKNFDFVTPGRLSLYQHDPQIIANVDTPVIWDRQARVDLIFEHILGSSEVKIKVTDWFEFQYDVTAGTEDSTRDHADWWIETDQGTGTWVFVSGTVSATYHRITGDGKDSATAKLDVYVTADWKYRVVGLSDQATAVKTVYDGSRLNIKRV